MRTTYDRAKDEANRAKHGLPLALAEMLDWSEVWCCADTRKDYGEVREIGYGVIGNRLYCVVFTQRGDTMRVISLRKANAREARQYGEYD